MNDPNEDTDFLRLEASEWGGKARSALFVVSPGAYFGQRFYLEEPTVSLGRAEDSSIRLGRKGVSRNHITLTRDATGTVLLQDVGSTNGTIVNGRRLQPGESVRLQDGDQIDCGGVVLRFTAEWNFDHAFLEEFHRQVCCDDLTGLANRRHFDRVGEVEFLRSQRYGRDLSLILVDVDHFKQINDCCGHLCGDEILRRVAARLQRRLRQHDLIARWGGDEFAVLLPETDLAHASLLAHTLCTIIANHAFHYQEASLAVTISLGVATQGKRHRAFADLIRSSDRQLLRAKRLGRNRVCFDQRGGPQKVHARRAPESVSPAAGSGPIAPDQDDKHPTEGVAGAAP
jgi:two-component system, cell cycle response regulator